jgi:hypothetical protein
MTPRRINAEPWDHAHQHAIVRDAIYPEADEGRCGGVAGIQLWGVVALGLFTTSAVLVVWLGYLAWTTFHDLIRSMG